MEVSKAEVRLEILEVCIIRDALKEFGSEGREDGEKIKSLTDDFQKILELMWQD